MLVLLFLLLSSSTFAGPNIVTYQGRLFETSGAPFNSGTANITVQILSSNGTCLLFQEQHTLTMDNSDGFFKLSLGLGTQETVTAPNFQFKNIFSNSKTFSDSNMGCPSPFTPNSSDRRLLRLTVNGEILSPDQTINSIPYAIEAQKIGGKTLSEIEEHANTNLAGLPLPDLGASPLAAGDSFQWDGTKWTLFKPAPADLPTNSVSVEDLDFASTNGVNIPQLASNPSAPVAGQTYYNTTANKMMVYNGTTWAEASDSTAPWSVAGSDVTYSGGNVGIGTASPQSTLEVSGLVRNTAAISNSTSTIDFLSGNIQYTTADCGSFNLHNMKDGGAYTFIVQGTNSATCSFNIYSDAGSTILTNHLPSGHTATNAGEHTIYTIIIAGSHAYLAWVNQFD